MDIIGAGFGRTGTLSLKKALEILGFGPCYHMQVLLMRPWHWLFWWRVAREKPVNWVRFFRKYRTTVDWPASRYAEELASLYPEAKLILTVRDPEAWYDSTCRTLYKMKKHFPWWFPNLVTGMQDRIIWDGIFGGRFADREHAIAVFREHTEQVKQLFPPERLLVWQVEDGWEPLCRFLGVPVPEGVPFPHLNDSRSYRRWIRLVILFDVIFHLAFLSALVLFLLWLV